MNKNYTEKDCLIKENKNLFKDYEIILDENNKPTKWQKSKNEYCEYCNAVYKNKCDDAASKINPVTMKSINLNYSKRLLNLL
jgi:hypothetical protein